MNFFSAEPTTLILSEFDAMHLSAISFFVVAIILTVIFRNQIREARLEKHFRYIITFLAITLEVGFKVWQVLAHSASFLTEFLPLDLCAISLYLGWALCFTKKKWMFKFVYFYGMGALVSLLVPNLGGFGINHFRYYHYFYVHGYIIFIAIYFAAVHQFRITFIDFLNATGILIVLAGFVMLIDYLVGANYMFLMHKPHAGSPLDMFGPWPKYLLPLVGMTFAVFVLAYLPWIIINRKDRKLSVSQDSNINISA